MTITVTIEELRDYENAMNEWHGKRATVIEDVLRRAPSYVDHGSFQLIRTGNTDQQMVSALIEWEAKNPKPTLIPRV